MGNRHRAGDPRPARHPSKIFSGAPTAYGAEPNTQACLVDLGCPGVLPVLNAGGAHGGEVRPRDRCRDRPALGVRAQELLLSGPAQGLPDQPVRAADRARRPLEIRSTTAAARRVGITRAHLEEDAGKSLHEDFQGMSGIDLNRAGTPLLEIVSEPDLRSAKEAVAYMKAIHQLVRYLGICDGNMQEGSFRCDANVSVRPVGQHKFGTRTEIKNLNSFRFVERAILFEVERQIDLLESGGSVVQETRLYDPDRDETRPMRSKEEANDYRYFPDPDLLPLVIGAEQVEADRGRNCPNCRGRSASASSTSTACPTTTPAC
jgi:aspartyl-tRNA(Asn)/glutamyl-tRNA(Gln) amidotransferase subunit B